MLFKRKWNKILEKELIGIKKMIEVIKKQWNYVLYKNDDNEYKLSVLCGTVGMYDVEVVLNNEQINGYLEKREEYIDLLAQKIKDNPFEYIENES